LSYFDANIALLARRQPELASRLRTISGKGVKIFASASGLPTASCERGSSTLSLHSRYNPLREAHQTLKKNDYAGADYFIFLGFGFGYLLDALVEQGIDRSSHFFIIESDLEILRAAFEARDLSSILSLFNIYFAWPVSGPELAEQWQKFFDPVQAQQSIFINHPPSLALDAKVYKAAAEIIQSQTFQIFTDINTLVANSQVFLDNFTQNLPKAANAPGVIKFAKMFSSTPAVIVSAGPSLDKNIHQLRGYEEHILILATDTALKPLLAAGIDPHFVLTGDPSHTNYLHLKGAPSKGALLVAEATSFPSVFSEFESKTITCIFENSSLRSLSDLLGNKGTLRAWGSVATMALDFALLLGCNPISFIGQDLAHTDGRIYCSGLCFDEDWFAAVGDPAQWQAQLKTLRSHRRTIAIEDIFGRSIESSDKLSAYRNWMMKVFHDHPEVKFINATEGGILWDNIVILSLAELLHRFCAKNLGISSRVRKAFMEANEDNLLYAGINISTLKGELAAMQDAISLGFRSCEMKPSSPPQELLKRLETTKGSIYFNPHLAPLLDSFNQMGNITFLRKRHALSKQPQNVNMLPEIKNVYSEYFVSVREALEKIGKALSQIETNLNL
jgi:hypothetical protein